MNRINASLSYEVNGFSITVNRYEGDVKLQVFVDELEGEKSIVEYVDPAELEKFIEQATK